MLLDAVVQRNVYLFGDIELRIDLILKYTGNGGGGVIAVNKNNERMVQLHSYWYDTRVLCY